MPTLLRKIIGYFVAWVFIHIVFLSLGWNGKSHDYFWPFTKNNLNDTYDFSEFLVYAIGPIVAFFVLYQIFSASLDEKIKNYSNDNDGTESIFTSSDKMKSKNSLFTPRELKTIKYLVYIIALFYILSAIIQAIKSI